LREEFVHVQIDKILFAIYYGRKSVIDLAILSFESEFIEKLDFGDIIYNFASTKARRAQLE